MRHPQHQLVQASERRLALRPGRGQCPDPLIRVRIELGGRDRLAQAGIRVVALSVDDEATTADLIATHRLEFAVSHGADARVFAEATGAFVNEDPLYVQSTGFVLTPAGEVAVSVYSSGAIGRPVPEDVIGLVSYLRAHYG